MKKNREENFPKITIFLSVMLHVVIVLLFALVTNFSTLHDETDYKEISLNIPTDLSYSSGFPFINTNANSIEPSNKEEAENLSILQEPEKSNKITGKDTIKKESTKKETSSNSATETIQKKEEISSTNTSTAENVPQQGTNLEEGSTEANYSDSLVEQILSSNVTSSGSSSSNTSSSSSTGKSSGSSSNIQWVGNANRWTIKKVLPVLPAEYASKGINIKCKLKIEINKYGSVVSVIVIESTGFVNLDRMIISVVSEWKFNQVTYDGFDVGYITFVFLVS